ncbi:MAG: sugar ABC transporter substrate-binding protein [Planctomycetaceae bacterium]|nr:sugar ABC transporter substrate-binding protein [Planctomycetaceae bacterium]
MKKLVLAFFAAVLVAGSCVNAGEIRIAMILKALDAEFWLSVREGARDAAAANPGVTLTVMAPDRELNVQQQVQIVEDQLVQGVDVLCLAPCGSQELMPVMENAHEAGIPVVLVDTDAPWDKKAAYVGTNNVIGGELAGDFIAQRLDGKGKVALITGVMGHQAMMDRVNGCRQALEKHPGIEIVAVQPANSERALAMTVVENILSSHPDLNAIFCANDPMAMAALEAVRADRSDAVVVGFNADAEAVQSVKDGGLAATIAQSSYNIGYRGVETAIRVFNGEAVPAHVDTGTDLVTIENADDFLD